MQLAFWLIVALCGVVSPSHSTRIYSLIRERITHPNVTHWVTHPNLTLPASVDLRLTHPHFPPIYDQGQLGSCTANAASAAYQYLNWNWTCSRLALYYEERVLDGNGEVLIDSGSSLYQSVQALEKFGCCNETTWSYNITNFNITPPAACVKEASHHRAAQAHQVAQNETAMKACLASGFPLILGIEIYDSFESEDVAWTGQVPLPGPNETALGGHAVMCVGYNSTHWLMRNSWGTEWGDHGYFTMPLAYLEDVNLCSDIWAVTGLQKPGLIDRLFHKYVEL